MRWRPSGRGAPGRSRRWTRTGRVASPTPRARPTRSARNWTRRAMRAGKTPTRAATPTLCGAAPRRIEKARQECAAAEARRGRRAKCTSASRDAAGGRGRGRRGGGPGARKENGTRRWRRGNAARGELAAARACARPTARPTRPRNIAGRRGRRPRWTPRRENPAAAADASRRDCVLARGARRARRARPRTGVLCELGNELPDFRENPFCGGGGGD